MMEHETTHRWCLQKRKPEALFSLAWAFLFLTAAFFFQGCSGDSSTQNAPPNILLIVSDQQHYQAFGTIDSFFSTPNLDGLAKQSTVFTHSFVTSPQCSPSRSSLYTGLYPHKTHVIRNTDSFDSNGRKIERLADSFKTIREYLKPAGYTTAYIGKWHLGDVGKHAEGYDIQHFNTIKGGDSTTDKEKTKYALAFLDKVTKSEKAQPFAMFLNYTEPHNIYSYGLTDEPKPVESLQKNVQMPMSFYLENQLKKPVSQRIYMESDSGKHFNNQDEAVWKTYRGFYRSSVENFDRELGKVLNALKKYNLSKNTIIFVTSDHGDMDTHHRLVFKGPFGYEQVTRVPLVIHVPRRFGGKNPLRENAFTVNVDILPTILDFAGLPSDIGDGFSLKPLLLGKEQKHLRSHVIGEYYNKQKWVHPLRIVRNDKYKYIDHLTGRDELYNLEIDPNEIHNLIDDTSITHIRKQLAGILDEWIIEAQSDPFYTLTATDITGKPIKPSLP